MKKTGMILIVAALLLLIIVIWGISAYNGLVRSDETVKEKWANVQSAYQRRADLIPNLVATVKQYSDYEGDVLTEITNARASLLNAQTPAELQSADAQMNAALARLLVVVENYPDLKANENYLSLQDELAGTENRIKVERDIYNNAVKNYNIKTRVFPSSMIAGMYVFESYDSFIADENAENAPDVGSLFE
ncbi:LemA family protein [Candidatus Woesearchaeota archaeon]|nr:MAG: LemA family protein [Candidatus Woesearchaeota archaeon]